MRRRLKNVVIISDHWSHMCWNRCLLLWSSILLCNTRFILLVDGNNIFDWNILPIGIVLILIKHWWNYFKNHLRKLNTSFFSMFQSKSLHGFFSRFSQELIYHTTAAILLLIASVYLLVKIQDYKHTSLYDNYIIVAVLGLINTLLYVVSAVLARRTYRGI